MASAAGIALVIGSLTAANQLVFEPVITKSTPEFNWRLIPASIILAGALGGLEKVAPRFAVGIASVMLVTSMFTRIGDRPSPAENLLKAGGWL